MFGISAATVRRDLSDLEEQGLLKRTHGGAVSISRSVFERDYKEGQKSQIEEKKSIARVVAKIISDGESILLDSGTTTDQIAMELANRNVTIITNSDTIPPEGINFSPVVYKAGGLYRAVTKSIVGPQAEKFIQGFRSDKAFIAANGISGMEVTTPHISEGTIKEVMIASAKEKYLIVDHTKFGQVYLSVFANVREFDAIITDSKIDKKIVEYYQSHLIPVLTEDTYHKSKGMEGITVEPVNVMSPELIKLDLKAKDKMGAIKELIEVLVKNNVVTDADEMLKAVLKREEEFSTGIGFNIAIPHAKNRCVTRASIAVGRSTDGVIWNSGDDSKTHLIFLIAVPNEAENQHLKMLAQISRKLAHSAVREKLLHAQTEQEILNALQ